MIAAYLYAVSYQLKYTITIIIKFPDEIIILSRLDFADQ